MKQNSHVKIIQPLGKTAFSEAYGVIQDPFGVHIKLMYDRRLQEELDK